MKVWIGITEEGKVVAEWTGLVDAKIDLARASSQVIEFYLRQEGSQLWDKTIAYKLLEP